MGAFGRVHCCWPSPAESFLALGLLEIYDQDFFSILDMYVFRNGASFSMRGEVGLSVQALHLLHRGFSRSTSPPSQCPGHYALISSKSYTQIKFVTHRNTLHFRYKDEPVNDV
jgi:hypothetical protein